MAEFIINKDSDQTILTQESGIELLGNLSFDILLILRDSFPDGKNFKEIKKNIEERMLDKLNKKNKSSSFTDQAIYYQLRKLKDLGFIETTPEKTMDGSDRSITSQKYKLTSLNFIINLSPQNSRGSFYKPNFQFTYNQTPIFLANFINFGKFNGLIILGENSKDAPFLVPIAFFLSKFIDFLETDFFVQYDRKILEDPDYTKRKSYLSQNLILLGGPNVNGVFLSTVPEPADEHKNFNESLPIRFLHAPDSGIVIQHSKRTIYSKEKIIGVIQLIKNPWEKTNKILTIGGSTKIGTEAAVKELSKSFLIIDKHLQKQKYCLIEAIVDIKGQFQDSKILE